MVKSKRSILAVVAVALLAFLVIGISSRALHEENIKNTSESLPPPVTLSFSGRYVVLDNGIVRVSWASPEGYVEEIQYGGIDNVLEFRNKLGGRGYWDAVLSTNLDGPDAQPDSYWSFEGKGFQVITQSDDKVEISFTADDRELNVDLRFVMLRGVSGFYSYGVFKHKRESNAVDVGQLRVAFKLRSDKFRYMAVSDKIQRVMPTNCDRSNDHSSPLDYREAVLITDPCEQDRQFLKGEVDDKYQYSIENKDNKLHGWISADPPVGFWIISPSSEFRTGGPFKQNLASHTGPTCLNTFYTDHYIGRDLKMRFEQGEEWNMVYGPYLVHLNSVSQGENPYSLWYKAKEQAQKEEQSWPYEFPNSKDYIKRDQRGSVSGQLLVQDSTKTPATSAWVGLTAPGDRGSWQLQTKGYQFWTQTDENGNFEIKGVIPGTYSLFASVPGFIGEYKNSQDVTIESGSAVELGTLVYEPPRSGPTLWEIGVPDRSAAEFYVPDPHPGLTNSLYLNDTENKYRQYGLWLQYAQLYPPNQDLVYNVGTSDYRRDWFFAHVTRAVGEDEQGKRVYEGTTWQIRFHLDTVIPNTVYTLQLAIASSNYADVQVRVNDPDRYRPHYRTGTFGKDNAIARHGIHGVYRLFSAPIQSWWLQAGVNTIYLRQPKGQEFSGIMYDYIRLEGPA